LIAIYNSPVFSFIITQLWTGVYIFSGLNENFIDEGKGLLMSAYPNRRESLLKMQRISGGSLEMRMRYY